MFFVANTKVGTKLELVELELVKMKIKHWPEADIQIKESSELKV